MLTLKTHVSSFDAAKQTLKDIPIRMENMREVSEFIHEVLEEDVLNRLEKAPLTQLGGNVLGDVYWIKLKDSTLKKRPDRLNKPILTDTGRLKESLKLRTPDNIADTYYKNIVYGSKLVYAKPQQKMRKYLFLYPELVRKINNILLIYVQGGANAVREMNYNGMKST